MEVLERLGDLIDMYEVATVSDLKALIGWTPEVTDDQWGWETLERARVSSERGGFALILPSLQPIKL